MDTSVLYELYMSWYDIKIGRNNGLHSKAPSRYTLEHQWRNLWFAKNDLQTKVDSDMRNNYAHLLDQFLTYQPMNSIERVALVILYDQVPRNIYRKTPKAYAYDHVARSHIHALLTEDASLLPTHVQVTVIIGLIHQENIEDQSLATTLMAAIPDQALERPIQQALTSIVGKHNERVACFGRIPERNVVLNRPSTLEELTYLINLA